MFKSCSRLRLGFHWLPLLSFYQVTATQVCLMAATAPVFSSLLLTNCHTTSCEVLAALSKVRPVFSATCLVVCRVTQFSSPSVYVCVCCRLSFPPSPPPEAPLLCAAVCKQTLAPRHNCASYALTDKNP